MARAGAPLAVLDDPTPLDGERIDVGVRVGWMLRMARLTAGHGAGPADPAPARQRLDRLSDMVAALRDVGVPASPTTLHRLETGRVRDGRLVTGYERVLGRSYGSLSAPIDAVCRTFPYGPPDRDPEGGVATPAEMDALLAAVAGPVVHGGDWLRWARAMARPNAVGLPFSLARGLARRLASEMGRAQGEAYMARYEALSQLRRSGYGVVVVDVARDVVAHPHVQVLNDLMSTVGESRGDGVERWLLSLLDDPRDHVVTGGVIGLENLVATSGGLPVWRDAVADVVAAYNRRPSGTVAWSWLSHLVRLMPPAARATAERQLAHPLAPTPTGPSWTRTLLNEHWVMCQRLAAPVTDRLGLAEQPLLARMLYELAVGEHETRAVTGSMLLGAVPGLARPVCRGLADLAESHPDAVVRERAGRHLATVLYDEVPPPVRAWWSRPGERQGVALKIAGTAGVPVADIVLQGAVGDEATRWSALYAAGMTRSHVLRAWAEDRALDPEVRGGAAWWLAEGGRVPR